MKKSIKSTVIALTLFTLFSFTSTNDLDVAGTYGVTSSNPASIELVLNTDNTFTYRDLSNKKKPINVAGNWDVKNDYILLKNYHSDHRFHTKWKLAREGKAIKSRSGMAFYTLVRLD